MGRVPYKMTIFDQVASHVHNLGERGVEEKYNRTAYSIVEGVSL